MGLLKLFIALLMVAAVLSKGVEMPPEWLMLFYVVLLAGWVSHSDGDRHD